MTILYGVILVAGVFAVLALLCLLDIKLSEKNPGKVFDERQDLARGNASRLSCFISFVYFFGVLVYFRYRDSVSIQVEPTLLVYVGLVIQIMASQIYCIMTRSALALSERPSLTIAGFSICGLLLLLGLPAYDLSGGLAFTGHSRAWYDLIGGMALCLLAVLHLISLLWKEKE